MHREPPTAANPRPLTESERDLLLVMLAGEGIDGGAEFRRQANLAKATPSCGCGCGSILLVFDDADAASGGDRLIVDAVALDSGGAAVADVLVFERGRRLQEVEVVGHLGPSPLPTADHVTHVTLR